MFVLMDMEWYDEAETQMPTQIAALRLSQHLDKLDIFSKKIRPERIEKIYWKHMAFNGGHPEHFKAADTLDAVMSKLSGWLNDKDILLWWHEESATIFKNLMQKYNLPSVEIGVVHQLVSSSLSDGKSKKGSPHHLMELRNIYVPMPEHCSINDVMALRILLLYCEISPNVLIEKGCLNWAPQKHIIRKKHADQLAERKKSTPLYQMYPFIYDRSTGIFHKSDCTRYNRNGTCLQGFDTIKGCIRKKLRPCECCKSEVDLILHSGEYAKQHSLQYSIVSPKKLVHFPDCYILKRIHPKNLGQFVSANDALKNGFHICPVCNPLNRLYVKEKDDLTKLCAQHELILSMKENILYITSKHSFWRILVDDYTGEPVLYHRNEFFYRKSSSDMSIPQYHRQKNFSNSLVGHIQYIVNHEKYDDHVDVESQKRVKNNESDRLPAKNSKKGRKLARKKENQQRKKEISRVLALIEELEEHHT